MIAVTTATQVTTHLSCRWRPGLLPKWWKEVRGEGLRDSQLLALAGGCPQLVTVTLKDCTVTEPSVSALVESCTELSKLGLVPLHTPPNGASASEHSNNGR